MKYGFEYKSTVVSVFICLDTRTRLRISDRDKYCAMQWTSSVGTFVNEAGSSMISRLNLPLRRLVLILLPIDNLLLTVSMDCFLWMAFGLVRPERMELLRDDLILEGRDLGVRTPGDGKSYP